MRNILLPHAKVRVLADTATLNRAAVDEFLRAARAAIASSGRFMVALAGGSTPKAIYSLIAAEQLSGVNRLPWEIIHVFFGDERPVPPDDASSNFRMANEALLSKVPIPSTNIHRIHAELEPNLAAAEYEAKLKAIFGSKAGQLPRFDLIMLGMGPDGHTASLFPGSPALNERTALVCSNWIEKFKGNRITFTFPLLNAAAEVLFVASGADKADMLQKILRGDPSGQTYPKSVFASTRSSLMRRTSPST